VDTTSKFHVKIHPKIKNEDLPQLPKQMQDDFWEIFVPILGIDPYRCGGLNSYDLVRDLQGWRALEVEEEVEGYKEAYRLIYRVTDTPNNKTVEICSFGLHDPAYDRAFERVVRRGSQR